MSASAAWRPIRSSSVPAARADAHRRTDRAGTRAHACSGAFGPRFRWLPQRRHFACAARSRRSRRVRGLTEVTLFPSRMTRDSVRAFRLLYSPMRLQVWPIPPRTAAPAAIPRRTGTFRCRAISPTPDVRPGGDRPFLRQAPARQSRATQARTLGTAAPRQVVDHDRAVGEAPCELNDRAFSRSQVPCLYLGRGWRNRSNRQPILGGERPCGWIPGSVGSNFRGNRLRYPDDWRGLLQQVQQVRLGQVDQRRSVDDQAGGDGSH
jgi:hypothetical protein